MATKRRFDAVTPRPKYGEENAVWWHRVGIAIENDKGQVTIFLDSVPVTDKETGSIKIMLFEKKEDERPKTGGGKTAKGRTHDDEEIPF